MSDPSPQDRKTAAIMALPFIREFGMTITSFEEGEVTVEMPFAERFSTPPGLFPASVVGALGDVAAVSACTSALPDGWAAATLDFTVKMTAKAQSERLIARGRVLQSGKTTSVGIADIYNGSEERDLHCGVVIATTRNFPIN